LSPEAVVVARETMDSQEVAVLVPEDIKLAH
jgi:hypothetical protein